MRKTVLGSSPVGWIVQGYLCHYDHSHEKHPNIVKNPEWRPIIQLVVGFDQAKGASLPEFNPLNARRNSWIQKLGKRSLVQSKPSNNSIDITTVSCHQVREFVPFFFFC